MAPNFSLEIKLPISQKIGSSQLHYGGSDGIGQFRVAGVLLYDAGSLSASSSF